MSHTGLYVPHRVPRVSLGTLVFAAVGTPVGECHEATFDAAQKETVYTQAIPSFMRLSKGLVWGHLSPMLGRGSGNPAMDTVSPW